MGAGGKVRFAQGEDESDLGVEEGVGGLDLASVNVEEMTDAQRVNLLKELTRGISKESLEFLSKRAQRVKEKDSDAAPIPTSPRAATGHTSKSVPLIDGGRNDMNGVGSIAPHRPFKEESDQPTPPTLRSSAPPAAASTGEEHINLSQDMPRFAANGDLLSKTSSAGSRVVDSAETYHLGLDLDGTGSTLQDMVRVLRSAMPSQRAAVLKTLTAIVERDVTEGYKLGNEFKTWDEGA